jgi:N-hydroxyarylamine O-acetyltransferase
MTSSAFSPDAYLERVGLAAAPRVTEDGLAALHRAQAYSIPFENFDILLGRGVPLEPAALVDKLVNRRRGGYCFELNGLLLLALRSFGFDVRPLLARVHIGGTPTGRGHLLLLVRVQRRRWIADVGFGGQGLRAPIPFEPDRRARQDGQSYRLTRSADFGTLLQIRVDDAWQDLYSFDTGIVVPADIEYGNHYTSTHPSSFFTYSRVAALPVRDGRISLLDRVLKISGTRNGLVTELEIDEGPQYLQALRTHFGIELDVPYEALKPLHPALSPVRAPSARRGGRS